MALEVRPVLGRRSELYVPQCLCKAPPNPGVGSRSHWKTLGLGLSSEFWASPHLKGLSHFSPASLSRNSGSAGRVRVISAFSPVPLPEVSGFLGEQMEFRKAKGPG